MNDYDENDSQEYEDCPHSNDSSHCWCWYAGRICCHCGYPEGLRSPIPCPEEEE